MVKLSLVLALGALLVAGCGGSGDCTSMCKDAQGKSCTAIKGDCAAFCSALEAVAPSSGCSSQKDSYLSCLSSSSHPCDSNCSSQESSLSSCVGVYCLTHASDKSCQTLMASF